LKELFSGFIRVKVSWVWYLAAAILLFGPFIAILIMNYFKGVAIFGSGMTASAFFTFFIYNFFSGPASEEMGWRGFALPRMLKKFNAITATMIQGVIWVIWHIPLVLVPDSSQSTTFWPVYITLILVINIILSWLWVNAKGSLFITTLAHFCFNFGSVLVLSLLNMAPSMTYNIVGAVLGTLYLVLIFVLFKARTFLPRRVNEKADKFKI
jgi:membrane protease YdiL (CAAX protease family)